MSVYHTGTIDCCHCPRCTGWSKKPLKACEAAASVWAPYMARDTQVALFWAVYGGFYATFMPDNRIANDVFNDCPNINHGKRIFNRL